jgi:hypothetical protein
MRLGLYDHCILPRLTHLVMRNRRLAAYRLRAVVRARGEVLEIGMGSGLNLLFYGDDVRQVWGLSLPCRWSVSRERTLESFRFPLRF